MSKVFTVTVLEGGRSNDLSMYFCNEAPSFEVTEVSVRDESGNLIDSTFFRFIVFTPTNGNIHNVGKTCRVPMERLVMTSENSNA